MVLASRSTDFTVTTAIRSDCAAIFHTADQGGGCEPAAPAGDAAARTPGGAARGRARAPRERIARPPLARPAHRRARSPARSALLACSAARDAAGGDPCLGGGPARVEGAPGGVHVDEQG